MRRTILGLSFPLLLNTDSAAGAAGLSVTGDAGLDAAVMGRLGLQMEPAEAGGQKPEAGKEKSKADQGSTESRPTAEEATATAKADEDAKTAEEIATEERETKINELVDGGKSREEAEAEIDAATTTDENADDAGEVQAPELTEEVKTWHEQQIAAKDEEISTLTTKATEAEAKVTELTAQLATAGQTPVSIAPIDPLFLIDDPAKLDVEAGKLKEFEHWLMQHWDGIDPVEASADGKTKAAPGYTAEQIRARYAQVKEVREEILPAARQNIQARKAHEAQARKAYPELFDPKRPEHSVAQNLLKLAPGLKAVVPNIHIVIGDALRGEKLRVAEEKARANKSKVQSAKSNVATVKAIKAGGAAGAVAAKVQAPAAKAGSKPVLDNNKFNSAMAAGGTGRAALVAALT